MIPENKCGLNSADQKKLKNLFEKWNSIDAVILYGSRAKGNFKPGSDIDLTIKAPKMSLKDLLILENEIDDLDLPYKLDISLYHYIENPRLIEHIQREGVIFYKL